MVWRAVLIIALIVAVTVLVLARAGMRPTVQLPQYSRFRNPLDYDVWIGVEHQVGTTPRSVGHPSTGVGVAGAFVGRGWRTTGGADGLYTLTALDGVTIPLWLLGVAIALPLGVVWYRRIRRSVLSGFDVLTVQRDD